MGNMPRPAPHLRLLPAPAAFDYVEASLAEQHRVNEEIAVALGGIRIELQTMNAKLVDLEGSKKRWDGRWEKLFMALFIAGALAACATVARSWARSEEARQLPPPIERQTR